MANMSLDRGPIKNSSTVGTDSFRLSRASILRIIISFGSLFISGCLAETDPEQAFISSVIEYPDRMRKWAQNEPLTKALLETYKPRIFVAPSSYLPINFYNDYLPNCVVREVSKPGEVLFENVDRDLLKEIQFRPSLYLDYQLSPEEALKLKVREVTPTVYGRIYTDTIKSEGREMTLVFLKYSLIFPYSGLPAEIRYWKRLASRIIGDPKGWHELDIHGAIHVILAAHDLRPLGVLLAQHNHHRVFLRNKDFKWPEDNRIAISVSQYSNEPYLLPTEDGIRLERTVANPMKIEYLFGVSDEAPLGSGLDKVYSEKIGSREISIKLELLPSDDPLYTAWISLGDRTKIFGIWETWYMRGPPGIDFYTFGPLKNLGDLTAFWFIQAQDRHLFELLRENLRSFSDSDFRPILTYQKRKLLGELHHLS